MISPQVFWLGSVVLLFFGAVDVSATASSNLQKLFSDEWQYRMVSDPLSATAYGVHDYNDQLTDVSLAAQEQDSKKQAEFLRRLEAIDRGSLSPVEQNHYDAFHWLLRDRLAEFEFNTHLMPITNRSGFHVYFPQLPEQVPLNTVEDYDNYVARLRAFDRYADQHIELMKQGIASGYVLPAIVLEGVEDAISPHIVDDPRESLLFDAFDEFPDDVGVADQDRFRREGGNAIATSVVPGYRKFLAFMTDEYLPAARQDIGASALPNGKKFYEHRVRRFTTLDISPQEVHDIGHSEVKRIRGEMAAVIEEVDFTGSFAEFVEFLRTDDRFYVDSPEQLMKETAYVLKKMDGELPRLFKTLPRTPYGIKRIPDYIAPKTTTAYYNPPPGDLTRGGYYYVNCYDLPSRPLYEIEALSLHEAVPGHHLQIALSSEMQGVPEFRKYMGLTAFVEGWALYSERLGLEVGFYQDPYSNFGRLTYEMWRALRLVVDTGMHYLGWTRQQAIDFMSENSALTLHNITTEVDRYISWPGQALGYKMGELKIRELRALAEKEMGDAFDVREFHDVVLQNGSVPLNVLTRNVEAYIATAR